MVVAELCRLAGWELKHKMIPNGLRAEVKPVETGDDEQHTWKVYLPKGNHSDKSLVVNPEEAKSEETTSEKSKSKEPKAGETT